MATTRLPRRSMAATILSIALVSLAIFDVVNGTEDEYSGVLADHFMGLNPRSGSRFLAGVKKGDHCAAGDNNMCPGAIASGTELYYCCNKQCHNVLTERVNCGSCGNRCGFGYLCCNGVCTNVAYDTNNCGRCNQKCGAGVRCEYGSCGYA